MIKLKEILLNLDWAFNEILYNSKSLKLNEAPRIMVEQNQDRMHQHSGVLS